MIEMVLPIKQKMAKPATNQTNCRDCTIRRMRGPNRFAAKPTIEKRMARAPKTKGSKRTLGYWKALAAAMTTVKGNGGGTREATTSAVEARCFIFFSR